MPNIYLSSEEIAECISNLIARNKLWTKKSVKLYFIVNSTAGCFNIKRISINYKKLFNKTNEEITKEDSCAKSVSYKIYNTEYQGHATLLTKDIVSGIIKEADSNSHYIIISVGGDGTSLEVQTALYESAISIKEENSRELLERLAIIRLPLGTGNDGTDGRYIEETFNLLRSGIIYSNSKVLVAYTQNNPPIEKIKDANRFVSRFCDSQRQSPWYSFNIASVGLDAFVNFVTNIVKSKFPGNLYHLCIPLSGLFYNRVFETGKTKIEIYDNVEDEKPAKTYNGAITLAAMGTSGNRTYGGGHKVLPNYNNLCIATRINIFRLIRDNKKFERGTHIGTDIGNMFSTDKIKIYNNKPMLLQCDGECYLLCKDHFPLTLEKRDAGYKVITRI